MIILYNIVVLIFEILFYSLFIKFSRSEGKLYRYILLFTLCSIVVAIVNSKNFSSYLVFILLAYIGFKYIVKTKTSLYDVLILVLMLLLNVAIELPVYLIFYKLLHLKHFIVTLLFELVKLSVVLFGKQCFSKLYLKYKRVWGNNNFNIRYIFSVLIYLFVILTIALLIKLMWR